MDGRAAASGASRRLALRSVKLCETAEPHPNHLSFHPVDGISSLCVSKLSSLIWEGLGICASPIGQVSNRFGTS